MSAKNQPAEQPKDPVSGGRYKRDANGNLIQEHRTDPIVGRSEASRKALEARTTGAETDASNVTQNPQE